MTAPFEERVIPFQPTERQSLIWDIIADAPDGSRPFIGYGGAVGGGKTRALAELAVDLLLDFPGNRILVGRKDLVDLRTTTLEEFDRVCPPEIVVKSVNSPIIERHIRLPAWPTGVVSRAFFRELKDPESIGSEQYGAVLLEEAGEIPEVSAKMLVTRLRHPAASKWPFVAASNPYPGWFERWFVNRELPEELIEAAGGRVHFIPARIADNPYLPDNYESLLRGFFAGDDDWLSRMVEGRFDSFEGQIYRELGPHLQWVGDLPQFRKLVGGLDFGGANDKAHKTAGVVAGLTVANQMVRLAAPATSSSQLVRFAHFEHSGADVHALLWQWMRGVEARAGRRVMWRADKTQSWGISLAAQAGFIIESSHGGADSVAAGIGLVKKRMHDGLSFYTADLAQVPEVDGHKLNGNSWYDRMKRYRWDEQPDETKAARGVPLKRDDDTADADRYMHEEADGFPVYAGPVIHSLSGRPRARSAV